VESHAPAVALLRKNLTACELTTRAHVCAVATETFLKQASWWDAPYHIVFADPPYSASGQLDVLSALEQPGLISPDGLIVLEQASAGTSPGRIGPATFRKRYEYGDTALALYVCQADNEGS
jgi:16S rRNA G966 N2-methylase RsmD